MPVCLCVYLHQSRHLPLLKGFRNGGSERLTVLHRSAFQKVFSRLVNLHLDHLPIELSPLRYQHLQDTSKHHNEQVSTLKFKHIFN